MSTVIFSAPHRWGKTRRSAAIRAAYGCHAVIDEWRPGQPLTHGAAHLTNVPTDKIPPQAADVQVVAQGWGSEPT